MAKAKTQKVQTNINEADVLKEQLTRALADYDNLRKRTEAEKAIWMNFARKDLLVKFLPIVDALETAQKHLKDVGLTLVLNEVKKIFESEGIVEIEAKGQFDANLHEAIDTTSGGEKNMIAEIVEKGYKFENGEVIRHAKVRVYQ